VLIVLARKSLFNDLVKVGIAGKEGVAADVPGEADGVDKGCRQATDVIIGLENLSIGTTELREIICGALAHRELLQNDILHMSPFIINLTISRRTAISSFKNLYGTNLAGFHQHVVSRHSRRRARKLSR